MLGGVLDVAAVAGMRFDLVFDVFTHVSRVREEEEKEGGKEKEEERDLTSCPTRSLPGQGTSCRRRRQSVGLQRMPGQRLGWPTLRI